MDHDVTDVNLNGMTNKYLVELIGLNAYIGFPYFDRRRALHFQKQFQGNSRRLGLFLLLYHCKCFLLALENVLLNFLWVSVVDKRAPRPPSNHV